MDTTNQTSPRTTDTGAWRLQVGIAFALALLLTTGGIFFLPVDPWVKGYLGMGLYFTVSAAFTLAKTVRDAHENGRLINRIAEARTEQMLREYSDAA